MAQAILTRNTLFLQGYLWVLLLANSLGAGVLVYKQHAFHSDSLAYAIAYDSIENDGVVTWVNTGTTRLRFEKTQFHTWTELPKSLPSKIVAKAEVDSLLLQLNEIEKFSNRFSKAAPIAKATLEMLREASNQIRAGNVRYEGNWMARADYEKIEADIAAANAQKLAKEMEAKAALEEQDRRLIEAEEKRKAAERQQREERRQARISEIKREIAALNAEISEEEKKIILLANQLSDLAAENDD